MGAPEVMAALGLFVFMNTINRGNVKMTISSINASCELSSGVVPGFVFINTSDDSLQDVLQTGYLNGCQITRTGFLGPVLEFSNLMMAVINTTDYGVVTLQVDIQDSDISLIKPPTV